MISMKVCSKFWTSLQMAQEINLVEKEENYTNPFTLKNQVKQVGRCIHYCNKLAIAISFSSQRHWQFYWCCHNFAWIYLTAKGEQWREKRKQNQKEEKRKEKRTTNNKDRTLIAKLISQRGGGEIFILYLFFAF